MNKKKDSIIVTNTSIQEFANKTNSTFNYIISNPPYFENSFKSENISRNTARHADKLDFKELILAVSKLLSKNGVFGLIISYERYEYFIRANSHFFLKKHPLN